MLISDAKADSVNHLIGQHIGLNKTLTVKLYDFEGGKLNQNLKRNWIQYTIEEYLYNYYGLENVNLGSE